MKFVMRNNAFTTSTWLPLGIIISVFCLAQHSHSAFAAGQCETSATTEFRETEVFGGKIQWQFNRQGNLTFGIDTDSSGGPDVAYRLATTNPERLVELVQDWPAQRTEATAIRASSTATDYVELKFSGDEQRFVFFTNPMACENLGYGEQAIELRALGFNSFPGSAQDSQKQFEELASQPIFRSRSESRKKAESSSHESVMICMAGGPGASFCSYSMGGIGPISTGSCSIECPHPDEYACCGPGFLKNCECIGSGGNSGGGGFFDPIFGPPGEDDEEDDEDDGEEDAFSIPVKRIGESG